MTSHFILIEKLTNLMERGEVKPVSPSEVDELKLSNACSSEDQPAPCLAPLTKEQTQSSGGVTPALQSQTPAQTAAQQSTRFSLPARRLPSEAARDVIMSTLLHSADISNPCKDWPSSHRWSSLILEEFLSQGDMEKSWQLPVSPNRDRDTTNHAQLNLNFIDFIVSPIFVALRQLVPGVELCCQRLISNRHQWAVIVSKAIAMTNKTEKEKEEEQLRWNKRTMSFHDILLASDRDSYERDRRYRVGGASALVTFICLLYPLRTKSHQLYATSHTTS
jgi:hypothetical protein